MKKADIEVGTTYAYRYTVRLSLRPVTVTSLDPLTVDPPTRYLTSRSIVCKWSDLKEFEEQEHKKYEKKREAAAVEKLRILKVEEECAEALHNMGIRSEHKAGFRRHHDGHILLSADVLIDLLAFHPSLNNGSDDALDDLL